MAAGFFCSINALTFTPSDQAHVTFQLFNSSFPVRLSRREHGE